MSIFLFLSLINNVEVMSCMELAQNRFYDLKTHNGLFYIQSVSIPRVKTPVCQTIPVQVGMCRVNWTGVISTRTLPLTFFKTNVVWAGIGLPIRITTS